MKVHFISIGGAIMHNLAIALKNKGYEVSGSDDEIFDPAKSRLQNYGLLPSSKGWYPEKITVDLDAVILGMHARADNPELNRAQELGIKIYSFPEYIYLNSMDKIRVAIGGSHGKTTITSMIMHVLRYHHFLFDYMVGSSVQGFENSLELSDKNPVIILEADEYLSSAINPEPKFLWYKPQIAVISGIAWDHANVFPTYEIYKDQFRKFIKSLPSNSQLIYFQGDDDLVKIVEQANHIRKCPYTYPTYTLSNNRFILNAPAGEICLKINGSHNLLNTEAARLVCKSLGIDDVSFYKYISTFEGAGKRLEIIYEEENLIIFRDFAHAPSKVKATVEGVKAQYAGKKLLACLELHTYSSLNMNFLPQYEGTMNGSDIAFIYINEEAVKLKQMTIPQPDELRNFFKRKDLQIFFDSDLLLDSLRRSKNDQDIILMMSSGSFNNLDIQKLVK